jgi:hypothetical protein
MLQHEIQSFDGVQKTFGEPDLKSGRLAEGCQPGLEK